MVTHGSNRHTGPARSGTHHPERGRTLLGGALTLMATLILLVAGLDWSTGNPSATGIEVIVPRILASIFILVGAGAIAFAVVFAIGGTRRTDFTD